MPLIDKTYPVTETNGVYQNIFPSNKPLYFKARRVDQSINVISAGADNKVKITTLSPMIGVEVGDFVVFGSDGYTNQSAKVLVINSTDPTSIDVDVTFSNSIVTNSFVNYHKSYYLQIRYVLPDSLTNDQLANELFSDYSQIPNDLSGNIQANITLPAELLNPDFDIATGMVDSLSQSYKIQYRESYQGNRSDSWSSPSLDNPVLLIHGTNNIPVNNFTDTEITKKYIKGYPTIYSFVYSDINDGEYGNQVIIDATQLDIKQKEIQTDEVFNDFNVNGVGLIFIDPSTIDENCAFITFKIFSTDNLGQYSGDDYESEDYQTEANTLPENALPSVLPFIL